MDLSNNPLINLDEKILNLKNLEKLKLNFCVSLDPVQAGDMIGRLHIRSLEMDHAALVYIPTGFSANKKLKTLSLRHNNIYEISSDFAIESRLEFLDLAYNDIDGLPEDIDAMKWLRRLDISYNPCLENNTASRLIAKVENLVELKANGTKFLGEELGNLEHLKTLQVSNSEITSFPGSLRHLKSLSIMGCDNLDYKLFFAAILKNDSLESLELSSKKIRELDESIDRLSELVVFRIKDNSLKHLPENFGKLKKLREFKIELNCGRQQSAAMVKILDGCESLTDLDLSNSSLTELPENIGTLTQLRRIELKGSAIRRMPDNFYSLKNLGTLGIQGTGLTGNAISELKEKMKNCIVLSDADFLKPSKLQEEFLQTCEKFSMNPSISNTFVTLDGSVIKIPAGALVDESGKPVKGNIVLNFQPYYSPAQIYLSGINMNYDSAGVKQSFCSAGMFNITAEANGKALFLNKQKKIQVDFQSMYPNQSYNIYSYDKNTSGWTYKNNDKIVAEKNEVPAVTINARPSREKKNRIRMPVKSSFSFNAKPVYIYYRLIERKGRKRYNFWITRGYDEKIFKDELPVFASSNGGRQWYYETDTTLDNFFSGHNKIKNKLFLGKSKDCRNCDIYYVKGLNMNMSVSVVPDKDNDRFNFVFRSNNDSLVLPAYPEYRSYTAGKAQGMTRAAYMEYLEQKQVREDLERKKLEIYNQDMLRYEQEMEAYRAWFKEQQAKEMQELNAKPVNGDRINRSLQLDGLGVWNCDIINRLPNGQELYVNLNENGIRVKPETITIIDQASNGFGNFSTSKVIIERHVNTILLVNLGNDKFGFSKFKVSDKNTTSLDIALNIVNAKNMTVQEFNKRVFN